MKKTIKLDKKAQTHGLPNALIVPIAVKSLEDLGEFVGNHVPIIRNSDSAFEVEWNPFEINTKLKIWDLSNSENIHQKTQVWVDVDYKYYRNAYLKIYPELKGGKKVIDHIYNRKLARIWGYQYLRLIPVDRSVNSCSGRGVESFASQYNRQPDNRLKNIRLNNHVAYADPFDLVKMTNRKTGEHPYIDVSDALPLFYDF